jgi:Uma2 family endonuclease
MLALAEEKPYYTYADVLEWDESVRAEIIDGELYMLATPSTLHQEISWELSRQLGNFLEGKPCKGFSAPFGVRLFPRDDLDDDTVVEPDIVVICDRSKIDERGCNGAPDLVIEILSPSNGRHEMVLKFNKYLEAGVREYWIIDPEEKAIQVHILDDGRYVTRMYDDKAPVHILPGCLLDLSAIFNADNDD